MMFIKSKSVILSVILALVCCASFAKIKAPVSFGEFADTTLIARYNDLQFSGFDTCINNSTGKINQKKTLRILREFLSKIKSQDTIVVLTKYYFNPAQTCTFIVQNQSDTIRLMRNYSGDSTSHFSTDSLSKKETYYHRAEAEFYNSIFSHEMNSLTKLLSEYAIFMENESPSTIDYIYIKDNKITTIKEVKIIEPTWSSRITLLDSLGIYRP
ncbi:MAG: hypothetical protein NC418_06310 [Muribaculaceae bacterium]|nr:hypothetical protein [Muribaculaceae bacterium]